MAVTSAIAFGGLAGYNLYSAEEQKKEARDLQKKQEEKANALAAEQTERDNVVKATEQRDSARRRQRTLAQGALGTRDTILTGASGTGASYEGTRKTLLGV